MLDKARFYSHSHLSCIESMNAIPPPPHHRGYSIAKIVFLQLFGKKDTHLKHFLSFCLLHYKVFWCWVNMHVITYMYSPITFLRIKHLVTISRHVVVFYNQIDTQQSYVM